MKGQSLGLIETLGFVPAVVAADAACKAAMVVLLGFEQARGGLVTVKLSGDVAAVGAAVAAGAAAAREAGEVVSVDVIPRPDPQVRERLGGPREPAGGAGPPRAGPPTGEGREETPTAPAGEEIPPSPDPARNEGKPARPAKSSKGKTGKARGQKTRGPAPGGRQKE